MSKVIMMCGVCGSGKTTYAKKKEQEGYIRLSIDEEMWKLYGRKGIDYPEEQYEKLSEQVEAALQKNLCEDLSDTMLPEGIETVPKRYAIHHRNKWMIDHADYVVTYVTRSYGGAAKFQESAKNANKVIRSL